MTTHANATYYALRGGFYPHVVAVISETSKQCIGHEWWCDAWGRRVRIMKSSLSGRFNTFEHADEARRDIEAIRDVYANKRRELDDAERNAINAVLARREGER